MVILFEFLTFCNLKFENLMKLASRMGSAAQPPRRPISPNFDDQRRRAHLKASLRVLKEALSFVRINLVAISLLY